MVYFQKQYKCVAVADQGDGVMAKLVPIHRYADEQCLTATADQVVEFDVGDAPPVVGKEYLLSIEEAP